MKYNYWDNLIEGYKKEKSVNWLLFMLKIVLFVIIVLCLYGVLYYKAPITKTEIGCSSNLSINNCFVLSTEK